MLRYGLSPLLLQSKISSDHLPGNWVLDHEQVSRKEH